MNFDALDMTEKQEHFFLGLIEKELGNGESELEFDCIVTMLNQTEALLTESSTEEMIVADTDEQDINDDVELFCLKLDGAVTLAHISAYLRLSNADLIFK